jgi:hypothetical protein
MKNQSRPSKTASRTGLNWGDVADRIKLYGTDRICTNLLEYSVPEF